MSSMANLFNRVLILSFVLIVFLIQARFLNLPQYLIPYFAFAASWVFIVSERRKLVKQEIIYIKKKSTKKN